MHPPGARGTPCDGNIPVPWGTAQPRPLLPGHWGRRGAHLHPQPSSSPPAHSESRATLHTPPPKQAPALPSKGSGKRQMLPRGVQIPGGALCPEKASENASLCQHHHKLQWTSPALHRRFNTSCRMNEETSERILLVRTC